MRNFLLAVCVCVGLVAAVVFVVVPGEAADPAPSGPTTVVDPGTGTVTGPPAATTSSTGKPSTVTREPDKGGGPPGGRPNDDAPGDGRGPDPHPPPGAPGP